MEDKLRQESQQTLSDDIVDIGKTAAAIGIGAAVFYRGVGGRRLSKFIDRYAKKASTISKEIDSYAYQDLNKDSLKKIWDDAKGVFQQPETEDLLTYDLETFGNENSMLAAIHKGLTFLKQANNPEYLGEKPDFNHHVIQPILKHVRETMAKSQHNFKQGVIDEAVSFSKKIMDEYSKEKNGLKSETDIDIAVSRFKKAVGGHVQEDVFNALVSDIKNNITKRAEEFNERVNGTLRTKNENFFAKTLLSVEGLKRYESKSDNFLDKILGDSRATIADILRTRRQARGLRTIYDPKDKKGAPYADALEELNKYVQSIKDEKERMDFLNLKLSPSIRVDNNGNVYSLKGLTQTKNNIFQFAANTLPGKILKLQDIINRNAGSAFRHIREGDYNPVLAAVEAKRAGKKSNGVVQQDYWVLNGRFYEQTSSGDFKRITELDNAVVYDGRFGGVKNLITSMGGLNAERERGAIATFFDLNGQVENNVFENVLSIVKHSGKDKTSEAIVKRIANPLGREAKNAEQLLVDRYEDVRDLFRLIQNNSFELSGETIRKLQEIDPTDELLNLLKSNDVEDLAFGLSEHLSNQGTVANKGLLDFVSNFERNPIEALNEVVLKNDPTGAYSSGAANAQDALQVLKTEIAKEYFIRHANEVTGSAAERLDSVMHVIEMAGLSPTAEKQTKRLAYGAVLDSETGFVFHNEYIGGDKTKEDVSNAISIVEDVLGDVSTVGADDARITIEGLAKDDTSIFDTPHIQRLGAAKKKPLSDAIVINQTYSPLNLIRDINNSISEAGAETPLDYTKKFFGQFIAGRKNMEDVTEFTLFPYFFLHRLGTDMESAGLGFSNKSSGSVVDLAKTIGLKRLLSVAVGGTMLEWGDDTFGAITGARASATMVNGVANLDLFARKILDITGIHNAIDSQAYFFAPFQYWGGKDGFYSYDQEKDYYENGYEEVRKGRYWSFGSVNEFRGGQIQYYQPNLTRRLNSDYYNKSLYNGYWDKWNHSLLPTPANPLSPLIYIMDPYYLENEHKYDRPYPVSGPMFSRGTPWGIVLNPTIGELIKPVQRLNTDRLDDDGKDVKAIIYGINKHIRDTAAQNHAYAMVFDREQITAGEYTAFSNPALGEYNFRIGRTVGEQMQDKKAEALGGIELQRRIKLYEPAGDGGSGEGIGVSGAAGATGNGSSPLDMLGQTNRRIYQVAAINANRGAVLTTDKLHFSKLDEVLNREDTADLIRAGQGGDLVSETSHSLRLIAGIYGYGANRAFGFGENDGKQIADAGDIDSFSRSFWDESLGGIGGGVSEIGRRFIPEYRRNIRVNPLLNTMPDWIPEYLRFGDPYAALPKGEARLPGKGYEALNNLHPDEYGMYGSFDRYKILADVAPNSTEFKVWKKIANATVKDPKLQKEMRKIQERVAEQQKVHDFYDYQILGNSVDYQNAVISEVNNDGTFRIHGSENLYTIAGIDFAQKHTSPNDYEKKAENQKQGNIVMNEYLHPGMSVTLGIDSNPYHQLNPDAVHSVNAAVFVDGESISQLMLEEHPEMVERKKTDLNAADVYAMTGVTQRIVGGAGELIAHLDLPMIHDKWLRVRSPLESYNAEQIYGTPYQTWSDILGTYVQPAWERAISDPTMKPLTVALSLGLESLRQKPGIGKTGRFLLSGASWFSDRGAFMGGMIASIIKPLNGAFFEKGKKIGLLASTIGSLYTSTQSELSSSIVAFGATGFAIGDILDETKADIFSKKDVDIAKKLFRSSESLLNRTKAGAIGAVAGIALNGMFGGSVEGQDRPHWTPERVKQKWELEEYFDRLTYIKYMGLYQKAAREAASKEGINIEKIFNDHEEWSKKRREIMEESDVNSTDFLIKAKRTISKTIDQILGKEDTNNHRFEYDNGFSINDLPGIRNGVFHSEEITEEERLFTLNALVTLGIRYNKQGTNRTQEDRDMSQLRRFEEIYGVKIPDYYEVHHMVEFSQNGADDPSNMIALNPDDHLYITEQQHKLAEGDFEAAQIGARTAMRLGEYGRAALLYKKAAESTMYGLRKDARWTDIIKSLPKYERDYFVEFMKEKDPDKQEEILNTVSPFLRKALKQVWGQDLEEMEDNDEYFQNHNLPGVFWEGWNPNVDLNKVKAKTIKNEGMLFSDFGIYESQYRDQDVINAPNISPKGSQDPVSLKLQLESILNGMGLSGVEVSVEPSNASGIQGVINIERVAEYKLGQMIDDVFSF